MSDYQLTSGPLRSAITIELHTHRATQLWQGRKGSIEDKVHPIIGMPRFLVIMNTIKMDAARNNPYADMWMLQLEERLLEARAEMNELLHEAEKALVAIKESAGIGTEATRAGIIETLLKRGYLVKKKRFLVSSDTAAMLIDAIPDVIKDPGTTALWEQALDSIASGELKLDDFLAKQSVWIGKIVEYAKQQSLVK